MNSLYITEHPEPPYKALQCRVSLHDVGTAIVTCGMSWVADWKACKDFRALGF